MVRRKSRPESVYSLLVDAGMQCHGYAADISRTHVLGNCPDIARRSVLNIPLIDDLSSYGGMRIEDNVIIERDGVTNVTRDIFENGDPQLRQQNAGAQDKGEPEHMVQ